MDFGSLDQAGFLQLLKRLQGTGGYSDDDSSNRVKELNAIAKVADLVSEAIELAGRNEFVSAAVEALLAYEALYFLPSDYQFTDAQRQGRLKAFLGALPKMVEARLDAAFDAYLGATSGLTIRPKGDDSFDLAQSAAAGGFYVQRQEPSADTAERRTLDPILARGMPARALGGKLSTGNATFGTGSIDRLSINTTPAVTPATQTKSRAEVYPFYPGSVIDAGTWKEIQAMLMWKSKGFTVSTTDQGRTIVAMGSIPAGNTAVIDGPTYGGGGAISWDNRLVQAWGVFSATDIRLGDLTARGAAEHCWIPASKLGTIAVPYVHDMFNISAGATVNAQVSINGAGDLTLKNNTAGTRYFAIMFRCTPVHTVASSTDVQPWVSTLDITNAALTTIARMSEVRDANGGGGAWTKSSLFVGDQGAIRRICYSGPLGKGSTDGRQRVVLDSSEDWRKRYVLIVPIVTASATRFQSANWSVPTSRTLPSDADTPPRLFYTGDGAAQGSATAIAYQHADKAISNKNVWIFADSTTGDLIAEMKSTDSTNAYGTIMFLAIASEKENGASIATQVPLHATQIHALDLNQIQRNGCYAQGFQGGAPRAYVGAETKRTVPTCPPLGEISEGSLPRRPVSWMVRERIGEYDDAGDGMYEQRQPIFSQRKRVISVSIGAGATIDADDFNNTGSAIDQIDYRDRFIWIDGRHAAGDITITKSPQVTDVGVNRISIMLYSGPFGDQAIAADSLTFTFEFARNTVGAQSKLMITNTSGATRYVNLTVECSGHLGLTDRRLYGASP